MVCTHGWTDAPTPLFVRPHARTDALFTHALFTHAFFTHATHATRRTRRALHCIALHWQDTSEFGSFLLSEIETGLAKLGARTQLDFCSTFEGALSNVFYCTECKVRLG